MAKKRHRERYEYLQKKRNNLRKKKLKKLERLEAKLERYEAEPEGWTVKSVLKEILSWILYLIVVVGITYLVITYVGQRTKVVGQSMEATLQDGDNLIVDKISYRFRDPKRFEVIVFPYRYGEDTFYIKRIIGLPGETIQIKEGVIYINGEALEENYGLEQIEVGKEGMAASPITMGEDEYFVMGDNRNNSSDSRVFDVGLIQKDDMVGRAWIRIWPLDKFGVVLHD